MSKKLTKRKLKAWIKDEEMSSKEYAEYGLCSLSKDEWHHMKILKEMLKKFDKGVNTCR